MRRVLVSTMQEAFVNSIKTSFVYEMCIVFFINQNWHFIYKTYEYR